MGDIKTILFGIHQEKNKPIGLAIRRGARSTGGSRQEAPNSGRYTPRKKGG